MWTDRDDTEEKHCESFRVSRGGRERAVSPGTCSPAQAQASNSVLSNPLPFPPRSLLPLHLLSPPFLVSSHPPSFLFFFCFLLLRLSMCIFLIIIVAFPSTHDICFHVPYLCTWPFFLTFLSALYSQESPFRPLQNAFPCQYCKAFPSISMQSKLLLSFLLRCYSAL